MLKVVPTEIVRGYTGELRVKDDQRESQVLYEYDSLFKTLLDIGDKWGMELPPLFSKFYIDHGCVTGMLISKMIVCLFRYSTNILDEEYHDL